jgi:hypothetical protein
MPAPQALRYYLSFRQPCGPTSDIDSFVTYCQGQIRSNLARVAGKEVRNCSYEAEAYIEGIID